MPEAVASQAKRLNPAPIVPATARGEATRRRLLGAAEREFGEKGFHGTSVNSITSRADVGQGTFYLYFHSKEEVFSTLVHEIGHEMRKQVALAISAESESEASLRAGMTAFLIFAQTHPGLFRIVQESQFVDEPAHRDYFERLSTGYQSAVKFVEAKGEIPPGNAEARAWTIVGATHYLGLRYCVWLGSLPTQEVMDEVLRFFTQGLGLRKA